MAMRKTTGAGNGANLRLAADIGGTFTDIAVFDDKTGRLTFGKALSTPQRLVDGISSGVEKAGSDYASANLFLHGSTVAINTMLERTGAKTALVTTDGFRDVYEIGRINRPDAYNLYFQKHKPLIERALCFEVKERVRADGEVVIPLDEAGLAALGDKFEQLGIEAVAIMFINCYANSAHEARAKEILSKRLPGVFVSASHELSQEYREFERTSTVAANAFIGPKVRRYIGEIDAHIRKDNFNGSFLIVQSTGGLYESEQAQSQCVRMLESGPAAGVIGTQALCHTLGIKNAIAFDMGGTTAKAGVIYKGEALTTGAALIGGYDKALPVQIAMMDIFEVGTGGGSIARVEDGALLVGPQSAGAQPGPACYGLGGTEPTVTDANLMLGRLGADRFLGGEMKLDVQAAERALARVGKPLDMNATQAADGILRIAATAMSYAVKGVTTERGLDAGDFALVAYGGAGPLHAVDGGARDRHPQRHHSRRAGRVLGLRHAVLRPALRLCPHAPDAACRRAVRRDRGGVQGSGAAGPRRHRLDLGEAAQDHGEARARHALCRPGASGHGRIADERVRRSRTARRSSSISTTTICSATAPRRRPSAPRSSACASPLPG